MIIILTFHNFAITILYWIILQASVELQGIKGLWSLRCSTSDVYDTFLVVSFINETRVLAMNMEDELEETEIEGFYAQAQTLFCQNAINDQLVQVECLIHLCSIVMLSNITSFDHTIIYLFFCFFVFFG